MSTRAKFFVTKIENTDDGNRVELCAVTSGSDENDSFFKFTPAGFIQLQIVNPDVKFEAEKEYYVDFSPAD